MAIDPQQIATEQTQRAALAQGGAPTEMAGSPENAVRLAGLGKLGPGVLSSINKLGKSVSVDKVTPDPVPYSVLPHLQKHQRRYLLTCKPRLVLSRKLT